MERDSKIYSGELDKVNNAIKNLYFPEDEAYADIRDFINGPSKRIRSILGILFLKLNNRDISDDVINILTAGELIHNASLLHDDVIDGAEIRRNEKTISEKHNPHISILSGDYLISQAVNILIKIGNFNILNEFFNCMQSMCEAEIKQYRFRNSDITLENYLNICRGKTASLFSTIIVSLSLLSDIDKKYAQEVGNLFGIIFQLRNDTKPNSIKDDTKNGIKTVVNIFGIEKTEDLIDNYKRELLNIIDKNEENIYKTALEGLIREL